MEKVIRVNTTLYPKLLRQIDFYARQRLEDRSTAIRQLISRGLKIELKGGILESLREHKLTVREAALLLDVEYWEIQQMMDEAGISGIEVPSKELLAAKDRF